MEEFRNQQHTRQKGLTITRPSNLLALTAQIRSCTFDIRCPYAKCFTELSSFCIIRKEIKKLAGGFKLNQVTRKKVLWYHLKSEFTPFRRVATVGLTRILC